MGGLPAWASTYGDKAFNSAKDEASLLTDTGVRLVPIRKANMRSNLWADKLFLREFRKRIETLNSQCEVMGLQRLRACGPMPALRSRSTPPSWPSSVPTLASNHGITGCGRIAGCAWHRVPGPGRRRWPWA